MEMNENRILKFDFFRTLAILFVVVGHYFNKITILSNSADSGVDLFFVLSGYLVTKSIFKEYNFNQFNRVKLYIINRLTKILPSYIAFFFIAILLLTYLKFNISDIPTINEWKQYLFFYRNYGGPPARYPFEHLWSISCEFQFYFILLLSYIFIKQPQNFYRFWVLIFILSILWKLQSVFTLWAEWPTYTHNRIDAFALGVILCFNSNIKFLQNKFIVIFSIITFIVFQYFNFSFDNHRLINRIIIPILVFILLNQNFNITNTIVKTVSEICAKYSYNLYLWHYLVLYLLENFNLKYDFILYIFLSSIFTFLFTHLIELPFLKLKNKCSY